MLYYLNRRFLASPICSRKLLYFYKFIELLYCIKGSLNIFPNIVIVLRVFLTMPVSVAEAERSFSVMKRIKNYLRSTMCQERLNELATLNIN